MKRVKSAIIVVMAAFLFFGTSCGNNSKKTESVETKAVAVITVDSLLANAEALIGQEVAIEGVCTHTCSHGATKMFLMGSEKSKTIRVEAAELGSFDAKCVNAIVNVKGIVREERIDEAYLQKMEADAASGEAEKHGEGDGEEGCDNEKNARGETGNSIQERVADFRARIAENEKATGKAYLSFYYVEALSYEIQ